VDSLSIYRLCFLSLILGSLLVALTIRRLRHRPRALLTLRILGVAMIVAGLAVCSITGGYNRRSPNAPIMYSAPAEQSAHPLWNGRDPRSP
jgi:hypothetical protein